MEAVTCCYTKLFLYRPRINTIARCTALAVHQRRHYSVLSPRRGHAKHAFLGLHLQFVINRYWTNGFVQGQYYHKYHSHSEGPEIEIQPDTFNSAQKAKKFVKKLRRKQRAILLTELQLLSQEQNKDYANQDDASLLLPPSRRQLNLVVLNNAVPFIGFGFLDNAIMIIAGDYIDWRIGAVLGISTLAAAGLGNLISDLAGVVLAGYVEAFAARLGLPSPNLSLEQYDMNSSKIAAALGRCAGIALGCLLGMFPLLFLNTDTKGAHVDQAEEESGV